MALPEATATMLRYARTIACRAVAQSLETPAGVIHLNFPFREPLVPSPADGQVPIEDEAFTGRPDGQPFVRATSGQRLVSPQVLAQLATELASVQRGLIVAGPQADPSFPPAVAGLSAELGYPILADPLSQARCGPHDRQAVIDAYDAFLRGPSLVERLAPEVILRFGMPPTSKPLQLFLQRYSQVRQILVDDEGAWNDATRSASDTIHANASSLCAALSDAVRALDCPPALSPWLNLWREVNRRSHRATSVQVQSFAEPFEGRVFTELAECLPDGATCYVSNSMPVRDLDTFCPSHGRSIRFLANRGVNGIDGVVSSALGACAAGQGPLILVIGDLAFFHDLNGLLAAKLHRLRATIILMNNDGGGIFSFLPQAAHPEHFERLFGTPHGLNFRPAAEMYGAAFCRIADWAAFRAAVNGGLQAEGVSIIEVASDRESNVSMHRAVWQSVSAALAEMATAPDAG
jgi:2-succinyl-5-enolpyruvyl-6-hydroxy-3-cyclohexene-1-carboxylate synthase